MTAVTSLSCHCSVGPEHIGVGSVLTWYSWTGVLTVLMTKVLRWSEWWGMMIAAGLLWMQWA